MAKSDITFDGDIFNPDRVPPLAKKVNAYLISQSLAAPQGSEWWEVRSSHPLQNAAPDIGLADWSSRVSASPR